MIIDKILEYYPNYSHEFNFLFLLISTVLYKSTKHWNNFDPHCISKSIYSVMTLMSLTQVATKGKDLRARRE
jgi:hypothetical protein